MGDPYAVGFHGMAQSIGISPNIVCVAGEHETARQEAYVLS